MLVNARILFLRAQDVLVDPAQAVPQRCAPGVCVDGGVRDSVKVPIRGDGRDHAYLSSGFEYVRLREHERLGALLARVRAEGLSGADSPATAVSGGVSGAIPQLLGLALRHHH